MYSTYHKINGGINVFILRFKKVLNLFCCVYVKISLFKYWILGGIFFGLLCHAFTKNFHTSSPQISFSLPHLQLYPPTLLSILFINGDVKKWQQTYYKNMATYIPNFINMALRPHAIPTTP